MDHAYETEAPVFPRVLQPPNDLASLRLSNTESSLAGALPW